MYVFLLSNGDAVQVGSRIDVINWYQLTYSILFGHRYFQPSLNDVQKFLDDYEVKLMKISLINFEEVE